MSTALILAALIAGPPSFCDVAAVARAEAAVVTAERLAFETMDPAGTRVARALVAAAVEQLRAARALCDVREDSPKAAPFEPTVDPWDNIDDAEIAWLGMQAATADVFESWQAAVRP